MLPQLVHVVSRESSSKRVRALLEMNEAESDVSGPGSEFVIARLMELLLVEVLRSLTLDSHPVQAGLLAGLDDPVTAHALMAMHSDIARPWTTAKLARLCGASRAAFAMRFGKVVGIRPIDYLRHRPDRAGHRFSVGKCFQHRVYACRGLLPKQFAEIASR
jgi:hypothetical protein